MKRINKEVWLQIEKSILDLNRPELEKRFWELSDEMTSLPIYQHSVYWEMELKYMQNRLRY